MELLITTLGSSIIKGIAVALTTLSSWFITQAALKIKQEANIKLSKHTQENVKEIINSAIHYAEEWASAQTKGKAGPEKLLKATEQVMKNLPAGSEINKLDIIEKITEALPASPFGAVK